MKVTVIGKNINVTPALKEMVEKKISKLDRYFSPDVEARATLTVQRNNQIFEVTIPFNGVILRCEETTEDMYKSIDLVEAKLERQIRKQRTKLQRRNNDSLRFTNFEPLTVEENEEKDGEIVKVKRFNIKPMSPEEAMLQMELIEHNFFVYRDADSNNVNVVFYGKSGKTIRFQNFLKRRRAQEGRLFHRLLDQPVDVIEPDFVPQEHGNGLLVGAVHGRARRAAPLGALHRQCQAGKLL